MTAFYETFAEEVPLPTTATVIGTTIDVVDIDIAEHGEVLTTRCHRGDVVQDLHLSNLVFAPDTAPGWIHAAYRRCLGLGAAPGRRTRRMEAVLVLSGRPPADAVASYRRYRLPRFTLMADERQHRGCAGPRASGAATGIR